MYEWEHLAGEREAAIGYKVDRQLRGLTAVPESSGDLMLANVTSRLRYWPLDRPEIGVEVDLDAAEYFERAFQSSDVRVLRLAPNTMTQMIHPDSLEPSRAIGAWISHPDGHDTPLGNSSWILLRASSGEYEHVRV